jgi:hypothetical protein
MYEAPPGLTSSTDIAGTEADAEGKPEKPAREMTVGEKFPALKNAPVQNLGSVANAEASGLSFVNPAAIKPLAIQVRNVSCGPAQAGRASELKCRRAGAMGCGVLTGAPCVPARSDASSASSGGTAWATPSVPCVHTR